MKLLMLVPMHISFESFMAPQHNSRTFRKKDGRAYNSLSTDLPLGSLSISAYLKKNLDINVELIDFNAEINAMEDFTFDSFFECCDALLSKVTVLPDFIGVSSLFSPSFYNFLDCGRAARANFPNAIVIGGGNIPTNSYKKIYQEMACDFFDGLCYGEGEKPMLELLQSADPKKTLEESTSWITPRKIGRSFQPQHNVIEDLDEIPFFDYDLCDLDKHASNQVAGSSFHSVKTKRGFHIMTSRGCPYLCTFCASHKTHGRKMRYHSLDRVREDMSRLVNEYSAGTVIFQDDHFMADPDRVKSILTIVSQLGLESLYQNGLTLYALDRPMLEAFHSAGVRHLVLPVESGSEKVLKKQMRKPLKLRISQRVARECRELGIYTNSSVLIGMPGETKADLDEGLANLRTIKTNWYNIACASPIVGSEMYDIASENNYITTETLGSDFRTAVIATEDFTAEYIQWFQYLMNLDLNFVNNNDVELGEYELALQAFSNVVRLRPDHAFAHFFSAYCHFKIGRNTEAGTGITAYLKNIEKPFWVDWVEFFQLPKRIEDINAWRDFDYQGGRPSITSEKIAGKR